MTYRTASIECPSCAHPLVAVADGQHQCQHCGADHVTPDQMTVLLREVAPDIRFGREGVIAFPRQTGTPARRCPVCRQRMRAAMLFEVFVEQCLDDGLWFGKGALEQVLQNAGDRYAARKR